MSSSYVTVTELPGELVPKEQYLRMVERYHWAAKYAVGKDVLECACGAGQGANLLSSVSTTYTAGDFDEGLVKLSKSYNPNISFLQFDALKMPFQDESFDIVLVCEAIYYFPKIEIFLKEVYRVLRRNGENINCFCKPKLIRFQSWKIDFHLPRRVEYWAIFP